MKSSLSRYIVLIVFLAADAVGFHSCTNSIFHSYVVSWSHGAQEWESNTSLKAYRSQRSWLVWYTLLKRNSRLPMCFSVPGTLRVFRTGDCSKCTLLFHSIRRHWLVSISRVVERTYKIPCFVTWKRGVRNGCLESQSRLCAYQSCRRLLPTKIINRSCAGVPLGTKLSAG